MEEAYSLILSDIFKEQYKLLSKAGKVKIIEKINKMVLEIIKEPRKGSGKPERLKDVSKIEPTLDPQLFIYGQDGLLMNTDLLIEFMTTKSWFL